jgi:hypothetical protein
MLVGFCVHVELLGLAAGTADRSLLVTWIHNVAQGAYQIVDRL